MRERAVHWIQSSMNEEAKLWLTGAAFHHTMTLQQTHSYVTVLKCLFCCDSLYIWIHSGTPWPCDQHIYTAPARGKKLLSESSMFPCPIYIKEFYIRISHYQLHSKFQNIRTRPFHMDIFALYIAMQTSHIPCLWIISRYFLLYGVPKSSLYCILFQVYIHMVSCSYNMIKTDTWANQKVRVINNSHTDVSRSVSSLS